MELILTLASTFETISELFLAYVAYRMILGEMYMTVTLTVGTFKIKRKDFNVQNVTNVVSQKYFNAGMIPAEVRNEILIATLPTIK